MKMKRTCHKGLSILLTLCMVLTLLPVVAPRAQATGTVTRTTSLDLSSVVNIAYNNSDGGTGSANPSAQNISDTAEGWSWVYGTRTLLLDGLNLDTTSFKGIQLPIGSTIVLADGSSNTVTTRGETASGAYAIYCMGAVTVQGNTGELNVTSPNSNYATTAFFADGDLMVSGGILNVRAKNAVTASRGLFAGGSLSIAAGSVQVSSGNADNSFAISSGTSISIAGGSVSATAGVASTSTAIKAPSLTFSGGTTIATTMSSTGTATAVQWNNSIDVTDMTVRQKDSNSSYTLPVAAYGVGSYCYRYNNGADLATDLRIGMNVGAVVSNQTVSGKVGTALSGANSVAITLTGLTFEGLAVGEDVSSWFGGLPGGLSVTVSAVTETTATLAFSGTPAEASAAVMAITIPGNKLSAEDALPVTSNPTATFAIVQSVQRTTTLDLATNAVISFSGGSGNPTTQNLASPTEGWAWAYGTRTLTLNGLDLETSAGHAIQLPAGSTIVLADGSSNTAITNASESTPYGIYSTGALTVTGGNGSSMSDGLCAWGDLTISGGTIVAVGRGSGMYSRGLYASGTLRIENATVTATGGDNVQYSYGAFAAGDIRLSEAQVTLTGGSGSAGSYGMMASPGSIMFSGGTTIARASGPSSSVYAMVLGASGHSIEAPFMAVLQQSGENYTVATQLSWDGRYYVCPGSNNAIASDLRIAPAPLGFPGSGTEADPYQISTAAQLKEMSDRVNYQNDIFADRHYELTANIDLNEDLSGDPEQWNPIGAYLPFTGIFDGNGHTIRGLYIHSDRDYVGLFGFIQEATVRNVGLVGGQIASDSSYCFAGGLVGFCILGTIEDCYNTGSVSGTISGGIVGLNAGGHIQDSYNTGAIAASGNGCAAGGIAGQNQNADFTIVNCYNTGSVSAFVPEDGDEGYVGGIAGVNDNSSIKNCYSTGALSGTAVDGAQIYVGGIAGSSDLDEESTIENAYWLDTSAEAGVENGEEDGCISKTLAETQAAAFVDLLNTNAEALEDTYPTLSPWRAAASGENGGYPVLGSVVPTFTLTISGGGTGATASGSYAYGSAVPISAGTKTGYTFSGWTSSAGGTFANASLASTTFTMPGANVTITANWTTNAQNPSPGNSTDETVVLVDGKEASAGTAETKTGADGKRVTTVTVDTKKLEAILDAKGTGAVVTLPITSGADRAVGTLTGQMVKSMENKDATLVIQTDSSSYTLPASEINIDSISKQLGANVSLSDITVSVSISTPADTMATVVENAGKDGGFTIVAPAVDFTITCTYGEKTVAVSLFNAYVERMIAIPDGVDPNKITTGVVVETDGTVRHVPTRVTVIGGRYYAVINSLTNSTYSVVWNPVEFKDVANHWAKDAVNNMGSRLVVTGVGNGNYNPDRAITRAEFAAIVVRALGLEPETGSSAFSDVAASEWYAGYIKTAAAYGIITGYNEKAFGPNDTITREQAMTMVARAMKITGLDANLTSGDAAYLMGAYADAGTVSDYAAAGVAACVKTEVVFGREGKMLAPLDSVTRAETAVMIERLLSHSDLI
ncbi:Listeria/Bacterioides repeat-containing protein [Sporobacter termitidis DSM 10068]|uniref:Listeria/Bacterioides repeat-containing protein n=1 Tax=Sporobacter termitidis DSM 10068 TaxID=1123282 RepID=A0A1M5UQP5_9FIRM|nr:S-layer homology domain-containing protein [Sporobacter termitidis]SHH65347.1 Listeria/Bacterioides repeat-containing protein [Sporobacter termitidis DSM 10068]